MPKFYDKRTLNHEQAVAWMKQQVLEMRFAFNETHTEAGIDAFVELADPTTGAAAACFLGVQVKTQEQFSAESTEQFSFYVDSNDLTYWNSSQIPVLLLVCRARTSEAYAIFVQEYFKVPENRTKRTVTFNKQEHRFRAGEDWQRRLINQGVPRSRGLSFPPNPAPEVLSSNLLEVVLPDALYSASTKCKHRREVIYELRKGDFAPNEFILREDSIWSVHSLHEPRWAPIVDAATIATTPFKETAFHKDIARRHYAKELLMECLTRKLRREEVEWSKDDEMFLFYPHRIERVRKPVRGKTKDTRIGLLHVTKKHGKIIRCRHAAMYAKFVDIGEKYCLQIDPTWFFSRDGSLKHPRWEDLIRTIRIMQKERDYHASLRLWHEVLTSGGDLVRDNYPFISFGNFLQFDTPVSIADALWKSMSDPEAKLDVEQNLLEFDK